MPQWWWQVNVLTHWSWVKKDRTASCKVGLEALALYAGIVFSCHAKLIASKQYVLYRHDSGAELKGMPQNLFLYFPSGSKICSASISCQHYYLQHHSSLHVLLKVNSTRGLTTGKYPIREACSQRRGKSGANTLIKIHWLKINQAPACIAPAQLPVILLGVNVNVLM